MRGAAAFLCFQLAVSVLEAQTPLGSLLYADPLGRGIRLVVVETGLPDRMTLRPEVGTEGRLRKMVLTFAGEERFQASVVKVLADKIPPAWAVDRQSGGSLIRVDDVIYWRYLPGQVVPVRFLFDRQTWSLQSADLPSRRFGGRP
jgi:hypothetical protein